LLVVVDSPAVGSAAVRRPRKNFAAARWALGHFAFAPACPLCAELDDQVFVS
jgi:hypothetical protein